VNYLLDANVLIDITRRRSVWKPILEQLASADNELGVCDICVAELFAGALPHEERDVAALVQDFHFLPSTPEVAVLAGKFKTEWKRKGKTLSIPDVLIAATALEYGCVLATDNVRDFPMRNLKILTRKN
jgi:hypothetical protein